MRSLLEHTRKGFPLDKVAVRETLSRVILRHVPLGSSSEVAWALWASIAFDVALPQDVGQTVGTMRDSVVAILALDAEHRGLLSGLDKKLWASSLTQDELRSEQWLLAYEAPKKGWLGSKAHYQGLPEFVALDAWDVEFYDSDSLLKSVPPVSQPLAPAPTTPTAPTAPSPVAPVSAPPGPPVPGELPGEEEPSGAGAPRRRDLFDIPLTVETDGEADEPYPW